MSFKLQAQLIFDENDIEELIRDKVADSGYVLTGLAWDEGMDRVVSVQVRPMSADERDEHGIKTPPGIEDVVDGFHAHLSDVQDTIETWMSSHQNTPRPAPHTPQTNTGDEVVEDTPTDSPSSHGGTVVATSIKDLLNSSAQDDPVAAQRAIDKAKSRARVEEIRAQAGSLEDAPVIQLTSEDGERQLASNEYTEFPD